MSTVLVTGGSGFVGLSGESRLNDPNTPYYHIQVDSGPTSIEFRDPNGDNFIAQTASPPKGVRPLMPDHRPLDRPGVPCETQDPPDMNAPGGVPDASVTPGGGCSPTTNPLGCVPAARCWRARCSRRAR